MKTQKIPRTKSRIEKKPLRDGWGVTLVELIVTITVISVGLLGAFAAFKGIATGLSRTRMSTIANNLAQEEVERLKGKTYYQLSVSTSFTTDTNYSPNLVYDNYFYPPTTFTQYGQPVTRAVRVDYAAGFGTTLSTVSYLSNDTGLKMITVYVMWKDMGGYRKIQLTNLYQAPSASPLNATIKGQVTDANNPSLGIVGAKVFVAQNQNWYGITDTNGNYTFQVVAGSYAVICSSKPYYPVFNAPLWVGSGSSKVWNPNLLQIGTGTIASQSVYTPNPSIVISQVVASTVQADTGNNVEYIELFNGSTSQVNIAVCNNNPATSPPCGPGTPTPATQLIQLNFTSGNSGSSCSSTPYTCKSGGNFLFTIYNATYIPPRGYYLMANTPSFWIAGKNMIADAVYLVNNGSPCNPNVSTNLITPQQNGSLWLTDNNVPPDILDIVGWNYNTCVPPPPSPPYIYNGRYSFPPAPSGPQPLTNGCAGNCIPFYNGPPAGHNFGFQQGDQIVRLSNVDPSGCSMGNTEIVNIGSTLQPFGRTYNYYDNANNFYFNNTGITPTPNPYFLYQTYNCLGVPSIPRPGACQIPAGQIPFVSGVPSPGPVVAYDYFGTVGQASTGPVQCALLPSNPSSQIAAVSSFTLAGVSTGVWPVEIDGIAPVGGVNFFSIFTNPSLTPPGIPVYQDVTTYISSNNFNPSWPYDKLNYSVLIATFTGGFAQGHVYGTGAYNTTPIANIHIVNNASPRMTTTDANGFYQLLIPTGTVAVCANCDNNNTNYMSDPEPMFLNLGQIVAQDFHLPMEFTITGFVTAGTGIGALPNIDVSASQSGGFTADNTSDSSGNFYISVPVSATAYTVAPQLDSSEVYTSAPTNPLTTPVSAAPGSTVFVGTITVTGALVPISGKVTIGTGNPITTGVLILASTATIPNPPGAISAANSAAQTSIYAATSRPDGTYSLPVRLSTTTQYYVTGFYPVVNPNTGSVTYTPKNPASNPVWVNSVTGIPNQNLAW